MHARSQSPSASCAPSCRSGLDRTPYTLAAVVGVAGRLQVGSRSVVSLVRNFCLLFEVLPYMKLFFSHYILAKENSHALATGSYLRTNRIDPRERHATRRSLVSSLSLSLISMYACIRQRNFTALHDFYGSLHACGTASLRLASARRGSTSSRATGSRRVRVTPAHKEKGYR